MKIAEIEKRIREIEELGAAGLLKEFIESDFFEGEIGKNGNGTKIDFVSTNTKKKERTNYKLCLCCFEKYPVEEERCPFCGEKEIAYIKVSFSKDLEKNKESWALIARYLLKKRFRWWAKGVRCLNCGYQQAFPRMSGGWCIRCCSPRVQIEAGIPEFVGDKESKEYEDLKADMAEAKKRHKSGGER